MCNPNAIAWCTKKSPGPIVKNSEFLLSLIALIQPGNQTLVPATVAGLSCEDNNTSKPYKAFPEAVIKIFRYN